MFYAASGGDGFGDTNRQVQDEHVQVVGACVDSNIVCIKNLTEFAVVDVVSLEDDLHDLVAVTGYERAEVRRQLIAYERIVLINVDPCEAVFQTSIGRDLMIEIFFVRSSNDLDPALRDRIIELGRDRLTKKRAVFREGRHIFQIKDKPPFGSFSLRQNRSEIRLNFGIAFRMRQQAQPLDRVNPFVGRLRHKLRRGCLNDQLAVVPRPVDEDHTFLRRSSQKGRDLLALYRVQV